jgi:hypothetical protein
LVLKSSCLLFRQIFFHPSPQKELNSNTFSDTSFSHATQSHTCAPYALPFEKKKHRTKSSQYCNICACVSPTKVVLFGLIVAETCCFSHTLHPIYSDKRTFCTMVTKKFHSCANCTLGTLFAQLFCHCLSPCFFTTAARGKLQKVQSRPAFFVPSFFVLFIHFFGIARAGATAHRRTFVVTQQ